MHPHLLLLLSYIDLRGFLHLVGGDFVRRQKPVLPDVAQQRERSDQIADLEIVRADFFVGEGGGIAGWVGRIVSFSYHTPFSGICSTSRPMLSMAGAGNPIKPDTWRTCP